MDSPPPTGLVPSYGNVESDPALQEKLYDDVRKNREDMLAFHRKVQKKEDDEDAHSFAARSVKFFRQHEWQGIAIAIMVILALEAVTIYLLFIYEADNEIISTLIKTVCWPVFLMCSIIILVLLAFIPL